MKTMITLTVIAVGVSTLSSCERNADEHSQAQKVEVTAAAISTVIDSRNVTGEIRARVKSDLSFRTSGRLVERFVDVGSAVKKGELLARLDPGEQNAKIDVARANMQSAFAQLTQAELTFERQKSLFGTEVTTRAALDQAQENLVAAKEGVTAAQAQLGIAEDAQSSTELRADSDGVITERDAEVGSFAEATQPIFTLARDGPRDAVFNLFEALDLEQEPTVSVRLFDDAHNIRGARVREISPTVDPQNGTVQVKVDIGLAADLQLGAPIVGIFKAAEKSAIQLPWSAMSSAAGQPAVWIVDAATSTVSLRPVQVFAYTNGSFAVLSGVEAGELVVVQGAKFLHSGQAVSYDGDA